MTRGYDHLDVNQDLVLDLRMVEGTGGAGVQTLDWSKGHMVTTLAGPPTWTQLANELMTLDFNPATPDYLTSTAAASGALNFTSGDFSAVAWFNPDTFGERDLMCKCDLTCGWVWYEDTNYALRFRTYQAGPVTQVTVGGLVTINTWQLVGFTRADAAVAMYRNGEPDTVTAGTHVDPDTAAALNFYIGCNDLAVAGWLDGTLWRPRAWDRQLSAAEMRAIFQYERQLFGV